MVVEKFKEGNISWTTDRFYTIRNRLGAGKLLSVGREIIWDFVEKLFHFLTSQKRIDLKLLLKYNGL